MRVGVAGANSIERQEGHLLIVVDDRATIDFLGLARLWAPRRRRQVGENNQRKQNARPPASKLAQECGRVARASRSMARARPGAPPCWRTIELERWPDGKGRRGHRDFSAVPSGLILSGEPGDQSERLRACGRPVAAAAARCLAANSANSAPNPFRALARSSTAGALIVLRSLSSASSIVPQAGRLASDRRAIALAPIRWKREK